MQILYQARGRELEQLTGQLRMLQEESAREKRILNHQLALAQGEYVFHLLFYEVIYQSLRSMFVINGMVTLLKEV